MPIKILLTENIHEVAQERLEAEGFRVERLSHAPSEDELLRLLPDFDVVGIRSKTEITEKVIQKNPQLFAIGAFCIGTNQIHLKAAKDWGIPVFNAPHSNTRSVAELVIAEMISLARRLADRSSAAHRGEWMKSAEGSREVRGKTVGIIGYGHIGSQLSILSEAMGMKVVFFDVMKKLPLGNARMTGSLDELLRTADFVTLHVPETPQTKNMIGSRELALMKPGSFLINASRGTVLDIRAVVEALKEGRLGGCAVDVFPHEPASNREKFSSELQGLPNVILTPHIGGSTEEAQYAIGLEVAESFRRFLQVGTTAGAVNFPSVEPTPRTNACRILNVHRNEPGVLGDINGIVSKAGANIQAQFLSTDSRVGYLVMDLEVLDAGGLVKDIQGLGRSIRTRQLG